MMTAILENVENSMKDFKETSIPDPSSNETIEKCLVENEIVNVTVNHTLSVQVNTQPAVKQKVKICKGHKEKHKSEHPEKDKRKRRKELEADPTIRSSQVYIEDSGLLHRDFVISKYTHVNNAPSCDAYIEKEQEVSPERFEEVDSWNVDQPQLLDTLDCTLINRAVGKPETRTINGHEVTRPYWTKTSHVQCLKPHQQGCDFLKQKNCTFLSETCLKYNGNQCLVWEKIFTCRSQITRGMPSLAGVYGANSDLWKTTYQPNQSFSDIATKLAIFDEMKKDLQKGNIQDITKIQLFKGSEDKCSVSIAKDIMYDCCMGMDGLATKIKLSKCTSDEIALAESREKGMSTTWERRKKSF